MGELKKWVKQDWVRIGTDGKIKGKCGTSKNKKNPDRCLPRSKAQSLSQKDRAATARKKKAGGAKGKQFVANTKKAKVRSSGRKGKYTERWEMARGGRTKKNVNLSVGRGEKRSVKEGGGLTAKGRAKYNRATGSNLKAPVTVK